MKSAVLTPPICNGPVGEGANLGLTQLARIDFGNRGGRLNTDAVDNSAGVNMSDYEVNLKILLEKIQKFIGADSEIHQGRFEASGPTNAIQFEHCGLQLSR